MGLLQSLFVFAVVTAVAVLYLERREVRRDVRTLIARAEFDNRHRLLLDFQERSNKFLWYAIYWSEEDAKPVGKMTREELVDEFRRLALAVLLLEDESPKGSAVRQAGDRFRVKATEICELLRSATQTTGAETPTSDPWMSSYLEVRRELVREYTDFMVAAVMASSPR